MTPHSFNKRLHHQGFTDRTLLTLLLQGLALSAASETLTCIGADRSVGGGGGVLNSLSPAAFSCSMNVLKAAQ